MPCTRGPRGPVWIKGSASPVLAARCSGRASGDAGHTRVQGKDLAAQSEPQDRELHRQHGALLSHQQQERKHEAKTQRYARSSGRENLSGSKKSKATKLFCVRARRKVKIFKLTCNLNINNVF